MNASASPVLIAYDGSDPAKQAISAAAELFAGRSAYVVTVWEPGLAYAMSVLGSPKQRAEDQHVQRPLQQLHLFFVHQELS